MELIADFDAPPLDGKVHRHFPITVRHQNKARRRTVNHIVRDAAKQCVKQGEQHLVCIDRPGLDNCHKPDASLLEKRSRPHLEQDMARAILHGKPHGHEYIRDYHIDGAQGQRARRWCRPRGPNLAEENSAYLAHSDVPFPSDHDRTVRRPTLEREDAFCDANTFKPHGVRMLSSGDDAEVADLYRMGLLYDDGEDTKTFNLNSIRRDDPVYTIRPAKRARRSSGKSHGYISRPLDLDLSFADLGDDDAIARYLNASSATTPSEIAAAHEEAIQHVSSQRSSTGSPPLRVIYELDSLRPSFDVETSQPPGLIDDSLSDYDCFSDSDLDETPTQREVLDDGATAGTWVMLD